MLTLVDFYSEFCLKKKKKKKALAFTFLTRTFSYCAILQSHQDTQWGDKVLSYRCELQWTWIKLVLAVASWPLVTSLSLNLGSFLYLREQSFTKNSLCSIWGSVPPPESYRDIFKHFLKRYVTSVAAPEPCRFKTVSLISHLSRSPFRSGK